jgi:hypothetical protein
MWFLALAILSFTAMAFTQEHEHMTPLKTSPEFEQMKQLVGKWEGTAGGMKATAEFRMTGGGSAIMQILGKDSPYEMVTMFNMDGTHFVATHYCAAHNQPRMTALPANGNTIEFKYLDGTNVDDAHTHMDNVKVTLADADHHTELWTSTENGKSESMLFDLHRVK